MFTALPHLLSDRCARKISRCARNDDAGKAVLSFSACSRRIFPLSFIPPVPYPPLRRTFPSRGRLLVHGGGILVSPPSPWEKDFGLLPPSFGRRCPEGAEVGSHSGMRRKVRQPILPFRHPERSRWIFPVAAVYDMHAAAQKIARALISHSPFHRCAKKISRFARNDDAGKAIHSKRRSRPLHFTFERVFNRKQWTTTPMVSYGFFSQYATCVSAAPMPRAVLMPMPVYMAKEARVAARLAAMSFLKKP